MGRDRSKSIVQKIASEVLSHVGDDLRPENESKEARGIHNPILSSRENVSTSQALLDRRRAQSFSLPKAIHAGDNEKSQFLLYPFTEPEQAALTETYLESLNYNSVLDSRYIQEVNDHFYNEILEFQSNCNRNIASFRVLLDDTKDIEMNLSTLRFHYDQVVSETEDFAKQSTLLLERHKELERKASEMLRVMHVFEPLEVVSKTLSTSGNAIIRNGRIMAILKELQEYLEFLDAHKSYRDAENYSMRYRQCVTRALTLIRNYAIDSLKAKQAEVTRKLDKKDLTVLNLDIIMYSEFRSDIEREPDNTQYSRLMNALAENCAHHLEYKGLISDVLQHYFRLRLALIRSHFQLQASAHSDTDGSAKDATGDIVLYCQRAISSYKRLIEKEHALFVEHFPFTSYASTVQQHVETELHSFFHTILEPLYDDLRNKIIRETRIAELCQLANLIASYSDTDDTMSVQLSRSGAHIEYDELLEPILSDSQARLIFRIQNYLDNKLLKYKPSPEDLQLGNRKKLTRKNSVLDEYKQNLFPDLYTPVGKALSILSDLYELVNPMVFDDMAHYIIHSCISMLKGGAMSLATSHLGAMDANLFYLKNLTMLKTQLNNFDIQFVRTETSLDFTSGIQELIQIFKSRRLSVTFNSEGGWLELMRRTAPKVINNMIDAKKEIESELSNSFNEFVTQAANQICLPLLSEDQASSKEKVHKLNDNVLMQIPQLHGQIESYIDETEIVSYLLNVLSNLIFSTYDSYFKSLEQRLLELDAAEELNDIMEPETFQNFLNETVSRLQESLHEKTMDFEFDEGLLEMPASIGKETSPDASPLDKGTPTSFD